MPPKTTHRSFRLMSTLVRQLERRARDNRATVTDLVERYVDEGLRREDHPLVVFRDGAAGRRAALVGTRLDVWQVIETVKHSGGSTEAAADYLGIPESHVRACVRYYAAYKREIDEWTRRMHAMAEEAEAAWRREASVLA